MRMMGDSPGNIDRRSRSAFSLTLLLILLCHLGSTLAATPCVRFADADSINQMFIDGGPDTKVLLCPSKVYHLQGTIVFTAADQELATYGYPIGSDRAILRVGSGDIATAIQGDCRRCARVAVKNLIIEGNREQLGRMIYYEAAGLIVLGGNEGQAVVNCAIKDPRGFTGIHVREGDKVSCSGAIIERNVFGPIGDEYDPAVDGDDPEMSPLGRPLADGISIACRNSFVRDNTFVDNTDAGIVIYCSPGSIITGNHIFARGKSMMAGILMVDAAPFGGDYSGTIVEKNVINAVSRIIRVGIGLGTAVWSDDIDTILKGGKVVANTIKGKFMGFGVAAAGLSGWTVEGNKDEATHTGHRGPRCFDDPVNPDPMPFLWDKQSIKKSVFQKEFQDHHFQYAACIDGDEVPGNDPKDPAGRAAPNVKPHAPAVVEPGVGDTALESGVLDGGFQTGSQVMDDILEYSQSRMLEAISIFGDTVDDFLLVKSQSRTDRRSTAGSNDGGLSSYNFLDYEIRIQAIERKQAELLRIAKDLQRSVSRWDEDLSDNNVWQSYTLKLVREKLVNLHQRFAPNSASPEHSTGDIGVKSPDATGSGVKSKRRRKGSKSGISRVFSISGMSLFKLLAVQLMLSTAFIVTRRFFRRRATRSKLA